MWIVRWLSAFSVRSFYGRIASYLDGKKRPLHAPGSKILYLFLFPEHPKLC
jgi:hypothetical protein